ncbi:MAG: AAA family ATPase [Thalassolituus maritimus]|uniref:AAA domain (Dynein-related subfamily) n=1 Tax=Thalassolituus maritimus TaxID=484498 RepID=A0A1N7PCH2_9GAMM|nr:AAA family ATPase [Thalassolituus maritimus]TPD55930.1 MAG: AAA family ATPase [Thalassolituus maritimus]SIT08236.1 AAA domain (dynein-related subfamily) [Thalassolituus maritimus]
MGKRSKKAPIPQRPIQQKAPKNLITEKISSLVGNKPDAELMNNLSADQLNDLSELTVKVESVQSEYEAKKASVELEAKELAAEKASIEANRERLENALKEAEQDAETATEKLADLLRKEKELTDKSEQIALREAQADAGFVNQHCQALELLAADLTSLKSEQSKSLSQNQEQLLESLREFDRDHQTRTAELAAELQRLREARGSLVEEQIALELGKSELVEREAKRASWEQARQEQFEQEYSNRIAELESDLYRVNGYRKRDEALVSSLRERLADFSELERVLKNRKLDSPEQLLELIDTLESDIRDYRRKLNSQPVEDLEEKIDYLSDENRRLEDQLRDSDQELQIVKRELQQKALGVVEREGLLHENRVLKARNDAISVATEQLKREIDDLTERQQGQEVFPALSEMDIKLSDSVATQPVGNLEEFVDDLQVRIAQSDLNNPLYYSKETLRLFLAGLAMSQLHIFQGISGTGKTSLAKAFAKAVGGHCTIVPVQAGWRDRDDLVGHYNAFEKRYYEKECLQALYRAQTPAFGDRFNIVLLDEMNLSRPEQYFAEFLAALELSGDDRNVVLMESAPSKSPKLLLEGRKMPVADNLWFIGTANHDETTFEFADKSQDRSFVLELGRNGVIDGLTGTLKSPVVYSANSINDAFCSAEGEYESEVSRVMKGLYDHDLTRILEKRFGISWGNRLERQARKFVPVYVAAGGQAHEAWDHLLSVRIFRDGKVTGRFDTRPDDLADLQSALGNAWETLFNGEMATRCEERLEKELERKEMA